MDSLLAVAGSNAAERWQSMWLEGGTIGERMTEFIGNTLAEIGPAEPWLVVDAS
jgi:hypothetical protein